MKFSNGQWLNREGYAVHSPAEVRDATMDARSLTIYAPCQKIRQRGDTLGGPLLTLRISSPFPDVLRVQAWHFMGRAERGPHFELADEGYTPQIADDGDTLRVTSGSLTAVIRKADFAMEFSHEGRRLTGSEPRAMATIGAPGGSRYMREQLSLSVGESIYGLGERFTPFVKNGQAVDLWQEDGGTSSEQAYKNIPFALSSRGYGVFVNHPELVSFEVASEKVSKTQFSVAGHKLDYYLIGGGTPKAVLQNYTRLTGRPALPPAWSFGLWLTTSFTTSYDEATVTSFIDGMAARDIPLHVFHFDCFWMKEFQWCDFRWDGAVFPDPAGLLSRLKARGLKICVWINPYIGQKSELFEEGRAKGYLVEDTEGNVWQWDLWQPAMALVDLTNPEACLWYQSKLKALLDMGVDCFKTDFGERIPTNVRWFDGSDPLKMHNYYTHLYNRAVFGLLERERGAGEAAVFARSATAGGQKFPVHWGGDCTASYPSMAESLRGGLSLCLSGFGFWSHDISGFEATATPDIYKRWAAFGLLSTHSRLHGSSSYRVPWLFDEEAVDVLRFFTKLKCRLMPYLFSSACDTAATGVPMMRAMVLEFPDDPACAPLDRQYLLGESLLVAPVFTETGDVDYYLPEGVWTNVLDNRRVAGGSWKREHHGYMSLPLMASPNSLIPFGSRADLADYDWTDNMEVHLFELDSEACCAVRDSKGLTVFTLNAIREGSRIRVQAQGAAKPWSLVLRNVPNARCLQGGQASPGELGTRVVPLDGAAEIIIELV